MLVQQTLYSCQDATSFHIILSDFVAVKLPPCFLQVCFNPLAG